MTRLRELRQARGWTLLEVAKKTGLSWGTIRLLETGKANRPRADTGRTIARLFGMKPEALFPAIRPPAEAPPTPEPEDVIEHPRPDRLTCFCGRQVPVSKAIRIIGSERYADRGWCSDDCLEADVRTRPCVEGRCDCRHRPE